MIEKFDTFFRQNEDKKEEVLYGGSGGSKSHSTCQHLVKSLFTVPDIHILITRKTGPSLKATTYRMIRGILADFHYVEDRDYTLNKTDKEIETPAGNLMRFAPLDDPQKIKSSSYNVVYAEEITEFTEEDDFFLRNTLRRRRRDGRLNQYIMTFNPIDINHWAWQRYVVKADPKKTAVIHSTHWDNPLLPEEYRATLEQLAEQDDNFYRVYCLGEPGVLENIIYKNYATAPFLVPPQNKDDIFYGLDFGFNNPSALLECYLADKQPMVRERIYESHLTNSQLIARMNSLNLDKDLPYYCDSAEPARIEELCGAGYNAIAADKSVKDGIDYVKRARLLIDPGSTNTLGEIRGYSYRKKGDQVLDEPVKFRDHAMDSIRYALYTHAKLHGGDTVPVLISVGFDGGQRNEYETEA